MRTFRVILSIAISALFFVAVAIYVLMDPTAFAPILGVPPWVVGVGLVCVTLTMLANGLFVLWTTRMFDLDLPTGEWASLAIVTTAANLITPLRGGAMLRAAYLRSRHGLRLTDFATTLGAPTLLGIAAHAILGLLSALMLIVEGRPTLPALIVFLVLAVLGSVAAMVLPLPIPTWTSPGLVTVRRLLEGWSRLRERPLDVLRLAGTALVALGSAWGLTWATLAGLGTAVGPWEAGLFTAGQGLAGIASLTPGALGFADAMNVYVGHDLGITPAVALLQLAVARALIITWLLVATFPAMHYLGLRTLLPRSEAEPADTPDD